MTEQPSPADAGAPGPGAGAMPAPPARPRRKPRRAVQAVMGGLSFFLALAFGEVALRLKNRSMRNYDIEMWRYARELKRRSDDPALGHEHVPNVSAVLQSVEIRTNAWGLRGGPVEKDRKGRRRILFLGSSITLGWGVKEEETISERVRQAFVKDGQDVEVLNAGIGNYNAPRYVHRYLTRLADLEPTDLVVHAFLRDAEPITTDGGNALLQHSQLAVVMFSAFHRAFGKSGQVSLVDHYRAFYQPDAPTFVAMKQAFGRLAEHARARNIRVTMAMTPDFHNLTNYPFGFIHEAMGAIARENGFRFVDLYPPVAGVEPTRIWAMPGDPHPNALGHELMANALQPALKAP